MADKDYKAFVVEGEAREPQVIDNISKVFFKHGNLKIITLRPEKIFICFGRNLRRMISTQILLRS